MVRNIPFKHQFRARIVDTDSAGHVHFSNYLRYAEKAEEEFMRSFGKSFKDMETEKFLLPKAEAKCEYLEPIKCDDKIEVILKIGELKEKSYRYNFEINNLTSNEKAAEGYLIIVYVDQKQEKPSEIPPEFRKELEAIRE